MCACMAQPVARMRLYYYCAWSASASCASATRDILSASVCLIDSHTRRSKVIKHRLRIGSRQSRKLPKKTQHVIIPAFSSKSKAYQVMLYTYIFFFTVPPSLDSRQINDYITMVSRSSQKLPLYELVNRAKNSFNQEQNIFFWLPIH